MTPDERRAALGAFEAEHGAYGHESWQIKNRITELERDETRAENEDAAPGEADAASQAANTPDSRGESTGEA